MAAEVRNNVFDIATHYGYALGNIVLDTAKTSSHIEVRLASFVSDYYEVTLLDFDGLPVPITKVSMVADGVSYEGQFAAVQTGVLVITANNVDYNFGQVTLLEGGNVFSIDKSLNAVYSTLDISIGKVYYESEIYPTGTATVLDTSTGNSYSVAVVDGCFPIYHAVDSNLNPVEQIITVRDADLRGTVVITLTTGQIVNITLSDALTMAVKGQATVVSSLSTVNTNDYCYRGECCYKETVFALPGGQWWKNDKSSFLLKKLFSAETIVFTLLKDGLLLSTLDNNVLGEYYSFENYTGFVLYWENVYSLYGAGNYQVIGTLSSQGIWQSQEFGLQLYDDLKADGTFRIEAYQVGSILRSGYNYDELGISWYQSYRISGMFGLKTPSLESDFLMTSDRKMLQLQDKVVYEYELQTGLIPSQVGNVLLEDTILGNEIFITDYNLYNSEIYRRVPVKSSGIKEVKHYPQNRNCIYSISFKDRFDNILKRV